MRKSCDTMLVRATVWALSPISLRILSKVMSRSYSKRRCSSERTMLRPRRSWHPSAACDRLDPMHARRRIDHHVTRRQLHALGAKGVFDHQFSAIVFIGIGQKQRGRYIGAHAFAAAVDESYGVVHMVAKRIGVATIAVEQGWKTALGKVAVKNSLLRLRACSTMSCSSCVTGCCCGSCSLFLTWADWVPAVTSAISPRSLSQDLLHVLQLLRGQHLGKM